MHCSLIFLWVPFHRERHTGKFNFAFAHYYFRSFHYIRFIMLVPLRQSSLQPRAGATHILFFSPSSFPSGRTITIPLLLHFWNYLLSILSVRSGQNPRNRRSFSSVYSRWVIPEHWADACIKDIQEDGECFYTNCLQLISNQPLTPSFLSPTHLRAHGTERGQEFLHHLCPFWFWTTDAILHFLVTPA